jgi:hypothetical protein
MIRWIRWRFRIGFPACYACESPIYWKSDSGERRWIPDGRECHARCSLGILQGRTDQMLEVIEKEVDRRTVTRDTES